MHLELIIVAKLLALDAGGALPFQKPRPMFADPDREPWWLPALLTLAGILIGLGVTTSVIRHSPASLKKYLGILALASLILLALTTVWTVVVGLENLG